MISQRLAEVERQKREEAWNARFEKQQEAADGRIADERAYRDAPVSVIPGLGAAQNFPGGGMLPDVKLPRRMAEPVQGAIANNVLKGMFAEPEKTYDVATDPDLLLEEELKNRGLGRYYQVPSAGGGAPGVMMVDPDGPEGPMPEMTLKEAYQLGWRPLAADPPEAAPEPMGLLDENRVVDLFGGYVGGNPGRSALREASALSEPRSLFRSLFDEGMNPAAAADSAFSGVAGPDELPDGYSYMPVLDRHGFPLKDADGNIRYSLQRDANAERGWLARLLSRNAPKYMPVDDPAEAAEVIMPRRSRAGGTQPVVDF
jgi:hypothetical protein